MALKSPAANIDRRWFMRAWEAGIPLLWKLAPMSVLIGLTVVITGLMIHYVIWPGYVDPQSRLYTSRLGYASILRSQGRPFPVRTVHPEVRSLSGRFIGEGFVRSEPVTVPIVPMGRITRVLVQVGERVEKGQLIAELDTSKAQIKAEAARTALEIANAELARTKIGSVYVLENERPEEDAIRVHAAQKALLIKEELHAMAEELFKQRVISRDELLRRKMENDEMVAQLRTAELSLKKAQKGRQQSIRIAEASVREAQLALAHREEELEDYKVYATVDGLVERCLIHEGEYNQEPGKPGFLILSKRWFEAHFDQTAIGKINVSDDAQVYLEAFASQPLPGKVTMVHPVVSFSLGGPETTRPLRATGTGAPEWPSTFSVRIEMDQSGPMTTVGLTGFARVTKIREGLAVPLGAVTSRSAGRGLVFVVQEGSFEPREVTLGFASDDWIEIRSGVDPGDEVIVDGHQVLQPDDRIVVESGPSADKRMIVRSS